MRLHLAALTSLIVALGLPGAAQPTPSARSIAGLPYQVVDLPGYRIDAPSTNNDLDGVTLADTDGDGFADLVASQGEGVVLVRHDGTAHYVVDQFNLPVGYRGDRFPFVNLVPYDATDDGTDEVVAVAGAVDGSHWRLWVMDIEGQRFLGDMRLPIYPERREDGRWDGYYFPIGELRIPGRPRPAVMLACWVMHDVHGRGLLAVDPIEGVVLWRQHLDAQLTGYHRMRVVDLDGDGVGEIIVTSAACNNLKGERLYGASDDSSRVFVLGADGTMRWQRALAGPGSTCTADVADVDGDGQVEVLVGVRATRPPRGQLVVWSATGQIMDRVVHRERELSLLSVGRPAAGQPTRVVAGSPEAGLTSFRWRDGGLSAARTWQGRPRRTFLVDAIDEAPCPEVIAYSTGRMDILDLNLQPLAAFTIPAESSVRSAFTWRPHAGPGYFHAVDGVHGPVTFIRAPRPAPHPAWFAGGAAAGLGAVGLLWRRRQQARRHRADQVETDPVILRELRLQLLARLQKGGHEKIGALAALRRLVWRLEAEAVREQEGVAGARSADSLQRVATAVDVYREDTRPGLEEILTLARRTGAPDHQVGVIQELLADLTVTLEAADAPDVVFADLHHRANALAEEAEAALQRLRRQVEACFECDLALAVGRVLQAQAEELERHRVQALATGLAAVPGTRVALDLPDLEFVLDNLVGNAIRSMTDTVERRLTVDATRSAGQVAVTVTDTGCGMAPEDWEAVFDDRWSTRPGGGYGLARSRRELAVYGGSLRVVRSAPGQGTTFLLMLPVAPGPEPHRPRSDFEY